MTQLILNKTSIPEEMKIKMRTEANYDWDPNDTEDMYKILFVSMSKFLGLMKSKENGSVALVINDYKGNLLMAAIVRYIPNEDNPSMPGNWNLSYTLDQDDLKDVAVKLYSEDIAFHRVMADVARELCNFGFISTMFIEDVTKWCVRILLEVLDKNCTEDDEIDIEQEDLFIARVGVEDGVKIMSIEPGAKTKQLIKGDAALEV